ncbi:MAG: TPM domain-containing protein [Flavobacteriales bacterium]
MNLRILPLLFGLLLPFLTRAADGDCLPPKPKDQDHLLFQYTDFLSSSDAERLDAKLVDFARETSNRILVVVVDDLCGMEPAMFATELGQAWGVGKKGVDNGVIVLVKPTGPPGQRKVFIATGYGLEGAIPDATCKQIVEDEIIPRFKNGDYAGGLDKGTDVLMALAKGEIDAKSYGEEPFPWGGLLVAGLFLLFFLWIRANSVRTYARTNNIDFWTAFWLMNQASRHHGGSWGGFTGGGGGGGWSGGGGGGGFGGFGGGSFGGGGAGGSW